MTASNFISRLFTFGLFARPPPSINLTAWERQVLHFLRRAAETSGADPPIEVRVAGGWVRDKLLHRPPGDLDVAVRHASGTDFAQIVTDHAARQMGSEHHSTIGPCEYVPSGCAATVIEPNPENSRHLETAVVMLDGQAFDFVGLRTEVYGEKGRVPTTVSSPDATPKDDAMRRDFTVNALFYNVHTRAVEDPTGTGLRDLRRGVLRTPLRTAAATLLEDPLRALRALRFASTLGFSLAWPLRRALSRPDLHAALEAKVSRERVGSEIANIVSSPRPVVGLRAVERYGLVDAVLGPSRADYSAALDSIDRALAVWAVHGAASHRDVVLFALLAGELSNVRPLLYNALRRPYSLERDVRSVLTHGPRLVALLDGQQLSTFDDDSWVSLAETLRWAGEQLYTPLLVYCAVLMRNDDLPAQLAQVGLVSEICTMPSVMDGHAIVRELGLRKGPNVGHAQRELIRVQLLQMRWKWKLGGLQAMSADSADGTQNIAQWVAALKRRVGDTRR